MIKLCLESAVSTHQPQDTAEASLSCTGRGSQGFLSSHSLDAELSCPTTVLSKTSPSVLLARDVSMSIKKLIHRAAQQLQEQTRRPVSVHGNSSFVLLQGRKPAQYEQKWGLNNLWN